MTFYRFVRFVVYVLSRLLFRVEFFGRENVPPAGPYIVAPSHRSLLDIPFAAFVTPRRVRFMAKKELFEKPFGRRVFTALGGIPVDRFATDRAALRASQVALEAGEPLAVFPEGTRHRGPVLGDLFDGAAYLALKLGVPIVPVGVGGSEQILAKGRRLPRLRRVAVVVGTPIVPPPLETSTVRRSAILAVSEELRAELQACFDEARGRAGV